jgi:hypothetical protein
MSEDEVRYMMKGKDIPRPQGQPAQTRMAPADHSNQAQPPAIDLRQVNPPVVRIEK